MRFGGQLGRDGVTLGLHDAGHPGHASNHQRSEEGRRQDDQHVIPTGRTARESNTQPKREPEAGGESA